MALTERRWKRQKPTVREQPPDFYGAHVEAHTMQVVEGDEIDINVTDFVRGGIGAVTKHPAFTRVDGTHVKGRVPLRAEDDENDTFEIDLETSE